jgi:hypothetical protein
MHLHHTTLLRAKEQYLLDRLIETLEQALSIRGGRIVSIKHLPDSARDCRASITYELSAGALLCKPEVETPVRRDGSIGYRIDHNPY